MDFRKTAIRIHNSTQVSLALTLVTTAAIPWRKIDQSVSCISLPHPNSPSKDESPSGGSIEKVVFKNLDYSRQDKNQSVAKIVYGTIKRASCKHFQFADTLHESFPIVG
ncbi:hypothetical protein NPIL_211661 [Nephila pilipes]|uniref:Uncharacterized protein n=1 Tax=Nephila pilipes TaxID=299642 RepID=A0A8X6MK24_NEPPI|nr:hypothetical protein NPIL_211661 [Nephila pilipes]